MYNKKIFILSFIFVIFSFNFCFAHDFGDIDLKKYNVLYKVEKKMYLYTADKPWGLFFPRNQNYKDKNEVIYGKPVSEFKCDSYKFENNKWVFYKHFDSDESDYKYGISSYMYAKDGTWDSYSDAPTDFVKIVWSDHNVSLGESFVDSNMEKGHVFFSPPRAFLQSAMKLPMMTRNNLIMIIPVGVGILTGILLLNLLTKLRLFF